MFRSRLEALVAAKLKQIRVPFEYESIRLPYILEKKYLSDMELEDGTLLEVKGVLMAQDRAKMVAVKKAHPDRNIVFVFAEPHRKVPLLKCTHAEWAEKNGFRWLPAKDFKKKDITNLKKSL